jgi:O-antigen/teichoic acid export membrane protein
MILRLSVLHIDARLKQVVSRATVTLFTKVIGAGAGFAFNVMLARQMGADEYGLFSFVLSLSAILSIVSALGLNTAAVAFIASYAVEKRWALLRGIVRWGLSRVYLLSFAVAGCLALVALLPAFGIDPAERRCLLIGSGIVVCGAVAIAQAGMLRGLRHVVVAELAESGGFRSLFSLIALLAALLLGRHVADAEQGLWIATLSAALALLVTSITLHRRLPAAARSSSPDYRPREWLRMALPLALITSAFMIQAQVDVFMVRCFTPLRDVGIFSAATRISMLVGFGVVSMSAVMSPIIAEMFTLGRHAELQKLIYQTSAVTSLAAAGVCLAGGIWGHAVLSLFGAEFVSGYPTLLILLFTQCLNALAGNAVFLMSMTGHQLVAVRAIAAAVVLNVVLNAVLIPRFGIEGAAWGSLAATVLWRSMVNMHLSEHAQINVSALVPVAGYVKRKVLMAFSRVLANPPFSTGGAATAAAKGVGSGLRDDKR